MKLRTKIMNNFYGQYPFWITDYGQFLWATSVLNNWL